MRIFIKRKAYGEREILKDVEISLADGEILCLLGASGAGKTTILKILAGLTDFDGEIENIPERVGYVFQEPRLLPHISVEENLSFVGGKAKEIAEILQAVELSSFAKKRPSELSGGEKQRVAIARAFLSPSPLLLLDEPFTALDTALKMHLTELFLRLCKEKGRTAVFVTHDLNEAFTVGDRIAVLKNGSIALCVPSTQDGAKTQALDCLMN